MTTTVDEGAFDTQDFLVLAVALDMLDKNVDAELIKARTRDNTSARQMAMLTMRQRVAHVRKKLTKMENAL